MVRVSWLRSRGGACNLGRGWTNKALPTSLYEPGPRYLRAGSVLLSGRRCWRSRRFNAYCVVIYNSQRVKRRQAVAPRLVSFRCNERTAPRFRDLEPTLACLRVCKPNTNATRPGPLRNTQPPLHAVTSEFCIQSSVSCRALVAASIFTVRGILVHDTPSMCDGVHMETHGGTTRERLNLKYYEARSLLRACFVVR